MIRPKYKSKRACRKGSFRKAKGPIFFTIDARFARIIGADSGIFIHEIAVALILTFQMKFT
jgi:hypothetical protein